MIIKINYLSNFVLKMRPTDVQIVPHATESQLAICGPIFVCCQTDTDSDVSTVDN